jgi:hypothetical protein
LLYNPSNGDRVAKTISQFAPTSVLAAPDKRDPALARRHAAVAIATSLHHQIHTGWLLLRTAGRFPAYDESHARFVKSSARVLRHAEGQLWQVGLGEKEIIQLASEIEGLWFAIDAMS